MMQHLQISENIDANLILRGVKKNVDTLEDINANWILHRIKCKHNDISGKKLSGIWILSL